MLFLHVSGSGMKKHLLFVPFPHHFDGLYRKEVLQTWKNMKLANKDVKVVVQRFSGWLSYPHGYSHAHAHIRPRIIGACTNREISNHYHARCVLGRSALEDSVDASRVPFYSFSTG